MDELFVVHSILYTCTPSMYIVEKSAIFAKVRVIVFSATFNNISANIVEVSFIGGGNRSIWRKPTTCRKSLTNFIT